MSELKQIKKTFKIELTENEAIAGHAPVNELITSVIEFGDNEMYLLNEMAKAHSNLHGSLDAFDLVSSITGLYLTIAKVSTEFQGIADKIEDKFKGN